MQQIGRYQVDGELGRGAMGIVYKAHDPAIGRTVAIKSIRLKDLSDDNERQRLRDRLFREAQSAGILSHPGIVTIYDIAEADGLAYIFMEFVDGPPLERVLASSEPLTPRQLTAILRQVALALDYAHKKGIVHRDIKPANIMLDGDGSAKITDFGVAKILSQEMTQAGTMMGTPNYMSPEQIDGSEISGATDQFALGVIAYEVLTGTKPFRADTIPALMFKILKSEPTPAREINGSLPEGAGKVLTRAMAKSPADRFENCEAFVDALAKALAATPDWVPIERGQDRPAGGWTNPSGTTADHPGSGSGPVNDAAATLDDRHVRPERKPEAKEEVAAPQVPAEPVIEPEPPVFVGPAGAGTHPHWEPRRALEEDDEDKPGHAVRNLLLVALLVLIAGGGYFWFAMNPGTEPAGDEAELNAELVASEEPPGDTTETTSPEVGLAPGAVEDAGAEAADNAGDQAIAPGPAAGEANDTKGTAAAPAAPQETAPETSPKSVANNPAPKGAAPPPRTAPAKPVPAKAAPAKAKFGDGVANAGVFRLTTNPAGGTAVFDGNATSACTTPCIVTLPRGRHTFRVTADGYRPLDRIIYIPDDPGLFLDLRPQTGTLMLTTQPTGLGVMIDGRTQSDVTPLSVRLPVGDHEVVVINGANRQTFPVTIMDNQIITQSVNWEQ